MHAYASFLQAAILHIRLHHRTIGRPVCRAMDQLDQSRLDQAVPVVLRALRITLPSAARFFQFSDKDTLRKGCTTSQDKKTFPLWRQKGSRLAMSAAKRYQLPRPTISQKSEQLRIGSLQLATCSCTKMWKASPKLPSAIAPHLSSKLSQNSVTCKRGRSNHRKDRISDDNIRR